MSNFNPDPKLVFNLIAAGLCVKRAYLEVQKGNPKAVLAFGALATVNMMFAGRLAFKK